MGIFSKKKPVEDVVTNLSKMSDLKAVVDNLYYLATDEDVKKRLAKIKDVIEYMPPTKKPEMFKLEERIANKLDDLRIVLSSKNDTNKINSIISDLDLLLLERRNKY